MEPIKVDFTGGGDSAKGSGKNAYLVPEKSLLRIIISVIGTVIGALVTYYFMLPPLNFKSTDTYMYFGIVPVFLAGIGSLLGALVFGCRPPIALANIIVIPLLYIFLKKLFVKEKLSTSKNV